MVSIQTNTHPFSLQNRVLFQGRQPKNLYPLINSSRMVDDFVQIAKIDSVSDESKAETDIVPSSEGQKEVARLLFDKLKRLEHLGLKDVQIDKNFVVTAMLPTNIKSKQKIPTIGLFAHMDIANDVPTDNIQPQIHNDYKGGDLAIGNGTIIPAKTLEKHIGEDIITSDGRTLLGADDKAGVAEILEATRIYLENPSLKRPNIKIAFTPDEEIGRGLDFMDVDAFGADAAYTIDGSDPAELESETFNAHGATIIFKGEDVHPGYAKNKMVNSLRAMAEFITQLPQDEAPETTEGYQGYLHPMETTANSVSKSELKMIIRDFDYENSLARIERIKQIAKDVEAKYPGCSIEVNIKEQYRNMGEYIAKRPEVLDYAMTGIKNAGLVPVRKPIRGGTDGSRLSLRGLPTPNLGAGGQNFHSLKEFVTKQDMTRSVAVILNTLKAWADGVKNPRKS